MRKFDIHNLVWTQSIPFPPSTSLFGGFRVPVGLCNTSVVRVVSGLCCIVPWHLQVLSPGIHRASAYEISMWSGASFHSDHSVPSSWKVGGTVDPPVIPPEVPSSDLLKFHTPPERLFKGAETSLMLPPPMDMGSLIPWCFPGSYLVCKAYVLTDDFQAFLKFLTSPSLNLGNGRGQRFFLKVSLSV